MTDPEDREQQADITRRLLYFLNAPLVEYGRLRGVLPAPGAVRIAVRAGKDESGRDFLYEIPNDTVTPYDIPGLLRAVLTGPQLYSNDDVGEAMGMTSSAFGRRRSLRTQSPNRAGRSPSCTPSRTPVRTRTPS
ncbi:hypothetical protein ACFVU0_19575 [Streptomyces sp. NPDC058122]|uniref:hypothetical protein n=1 Tax=Streptomyces sp. NPDC058122 TaxID=3346349 RepID=UPI0036E81B36